MCVGVETVVSVNTLVNTANRGSKVGGSRKKRKHFRYIIWHEFQHSFQKNKTKLNVKTISGGGDVIAAIDLTALDHTSSPHARSLPACEPFSRRKEITRCWCRPIVDRFIFIYYTPWRKRILLFSHRLLLLRPFVVIESGVRHPCQSGLTR